VELPSRSQGLGIGEDMVPREKLESIGMEYTHLLTSQLESQRVYFEELVGKAVAKASASSTAASQASQRAEEAYTKLTALTLENKQLKEDIIANLEKELAREKKKAERSAEVARGFGKSLMEEKKVSEGLMERVRHLNEGVKKVSEELGIVKEENEELKESNRDLLFSISAEGKLKDMADEGGLEAGELEGGTVGVPESASARRRKGKGKK
jgi:BRCA1-associated protein